MIEKLLGRLDSKASVAGWLVAFPSAWRLLLPLACFLGAFLVGCENSGISGQVFLTYRSGDVKPVSGMEMLLVSGDARRAVSELRAEYDASVDREARSVAVSELQTQRNATTNAMDGLRASMGAYASLWGSDYRPGSVPRQCSAEEAGAHTSFLNEARSRLDAYNAEMRTLEQQFVGGYMQSSVEFKTWSQKATSRSTTRITGVEHQGIVCWSLKNNGPLHISEVTTYVTFNGELLPAWITSLYMNNSGCGDVGYTTRGVGTGGAFFMARGNRRLSGLNGVPSGRIVFERINRYSKREQGLASGDSFTHCCDLDGDHTYGISGEQLREIEALGLSQTGWYDGEWAVGVEGVQLAVGSRVKGKFQPVNSIGAFRDAVGLLPKLKSKADRGAQIGAELEVLRKAVPLCQESVKRGRELRDLDTALHALEAGKPSAGLARATLDSVSARIRGDKARLATWVGRAKSEISKPERAVGAAHTSLDGSYQFKGLRSGTYTIVAEFSLGQNVAATWILPITVSGAITQDLSNYNMEEGSLDDLLERIFVGDTAKHG